MRVNRTYKCRICKIKINTFHYGYCQNCYETRKKDIEKYEKKLEDKRRYFKGSAITSLDEFDKCEFVYWRSKIMHMGFMTSLQYRVLVNLISQRNLYHAIKKEESNGK